MNPLGPLILAVPLLWFWMRMFSHMNQRTDLTPDEKQKWMLAFIFMNVFAAGVYYVNEYRDRR